jgi:hypothetical protein
MEKGETKGGREGGRKPVPVVRREGEGRREGPLL